MRNFLLLIFIFYHKYSLLNALIVVPFKINSYVPKIEGEFNVTDFINEYLVHDMYTSLEIGSGSNIKKVTTLISHEDSIISLSSNACKRKSLQTINDISIVSKSGLDISLYNKDITNKKYDNFLDEENNIGIINEYINMYNSTYLNCQPIEINHDMVLDSKINISNISMPIKDKTNNTNEKLCGILGIGAPLNIRNKLNNIPHFINYLKTNKIINDYSWTFKFYTKTEGRLIIGDLPHIYEKNKKFYHEDKFIKRITYSPESREYPWSFHFKEISFINANNEKKIVGTWVKMILVPNIGFIIGEDKYKNLILENYFQKLIDKNICVLEKTNITKYTENEISFGTSGIYEMFHCDRKGLVNEGIMFPKLSFYEPDLNYTFDFSFSNLFQMFEDRYYFLVIFPEDIKHAAYKVWYLGLPFYYPNQLVFNYDSKTIGIYDQNLPIQEKDSENKEKEDKKEEDDNNDKNNNNNYNNNNNTNINDTQDNNFNGVWRIIIEIIVLIIVVVIAYFIGKKINERRKKRANELNDENYDYTANAENGINGTEDNLIKNKNSGNSNLGF